MIVRFVDKENGQYWRLATDGCVVKPHRGIVVLVDYAGDVTEVEYHDMHDIIIEDEGGDTDEQ